MDFTIITQYFAIRLPLLVHFYRMFYILVSGVLMPAEKTYSLLITINCFMNLMSRHVIALVNHPKQLSNLLTENFIPKYWQKSMKKERLTNIGLSETLKLFFQSNLSPYNDEISFNCRELRGKGHIYITWFYSASVFIKKSQNNEESIRIRHLN